MKNVFFIITLLSWKNSDQILILIDTTFFLSISTFYTSSTLQGIKIIAKRLKCKKPAEFFFGLNIIISIFKPEVVLSNFEIKLENFKFLTHFRCYSKKATKTRPQNIWLGINFINIIRTIFFVQTLFWQLFSSYMYLLKAAETTIVQKICTILHWWNWHQFFWFIAYSFTKYSHLINFGKLDHLKKDFILYHTEIDAG